MGDSGATITPAQSRSARAFLGWSQVELATRANLSESTIRDFEKGRRIPSPNNLRAIAAAFDGSGIEMIDSAHTPGDSSLLSLRDYFAGLVLAAMTVNGTGAKWEDDAVAAYMAADAMLKAREAR